ncbi:hypothetical protein ACC761_40235, partial [Rhizobium ruizarguesonis]
PLIAQDIGIDAIRAACPGFYAWLSVIESWQNVQLRELELVLLEEDCSDWRRTVNARSIDLTIILLQCSRATLRAKCRLG